MPELKKTIVKDNPRNRYLFKLELMKKKRAQQVTTLVFTLFALSFFGIFAINPTISTITGLKKQLEDANFVYERLNKKIEDLSTLQVRYAEMQPNIYAVLNAVPEDPRIPFFTAQLQTLSKNANLTLNTLQVFEIELVSAKGDDGKSKYFSFSLSASGSSSDVVSFFDALSRTDRLVSIDSLSITSDKTKNTSQVTIKGKAFFKA